jgi:peptide/nickel transport system substrate-binding protein
LKRRRYLVVAAAFAACCATLAACATPSATEERSIVIGVSSFSGTYDTSRGASWLGYLNVSAVYESLLNVDTEKFPTGHKPNIATEYEVTDDGRTVTYILRDDVTYVDGTRLTAQTVADYFSALASDEESSAYAWLTQWELEFSALDEVTLQVSGNRALDRVGGPLFGISDYPLANPVALDDHERLASEPAGTGPYLVDETVPEVSVSFVRNPGYWNAEAFPFDTVEIVAFSDDVAALNALKSGQIDAVQLNNTLAGQARSEGFSLHVGTGRFTALFIADRGGSIQPALADKRVRQAISYAIDREAINRELNLGYGTVSSQGFDPNTPEYVEGGDDSYDYDPEKARRLMAEAGYADGFDLAIPSTTFLGINAWEPVVQQYLGDIGIRVTFDQFADVGAYFGAATGGTYPVIMYSEQPSQALGVFLLPDAVFAMPGYEDPTVDELWTTIQEGSIEEADAAQSAIGEYAHDEAWLTIISRSQYLWFTDPGITVDVGSWAGGFQRIEMFGVSD